MKIIFFRHGKTNGNLEKRYIGRTDEPLSPIGRNELFGVRYPDCDIVISSPMKRCRETAEIIYPSKKIVAVSGLEECDFGDFEGKNYLELSGNPDYQKWIDSGGTLPFPNGENTEAFKQRCIKAFEKAVADFSSYESISFVVHGGTLISKLEKFTRNHFKNLRRGGVFLGGATLILSTGIPFLILFLSYKLNTILGIVVESIFCYYLIAPKCLRDESMKVYRAIKENDTEKARKAVSMIVGRDTKCLDESGIIRAAVETVAENTSDGVTAPIMYMSLGGAVFGFFYKAVNTMDSMIGYKNPKYADLGRFAARLDDVMNYIPSRLTALVMIVSAHILGMNGRNAYKIWKRDRRKHASPNSAQTESVCAGALDIRLAGDAYYFGKLYKKEYIGDDSRPVENEDIRRANRLMYCTSVIVLLFSVLIRGLIFGGILW